MKVEIDTEVFEIAGFELNKLEIDNRVTSYTNMALDHTAAVAMPDASIVKITVRGLNLPHNPKLAVLRNLAFNNKVSDFDLNFSDGLQIKGQFIVKKYELADEYDGFQQYVMQLINAGKLSVV
jgi:predicted secreted protein